MADAAHAELYAESRRDGKCRRPVGMRGVGSDHTVSAHFMISPPLPQSIFSGALRRPLQIKRRSIIYSPLKIEMRFDPATRPRSKSTYYGRSAYFPSSDIPASGRYSMQSASPIRKIISPPTPSTWRFEK
ncbi:hypothetical protein [Burkholderia ambifaria]|uniref:hypothetical protein n=1 Tax=Burkholderia ambifaria TaxID=152480 RepID=UPI001C9323EB|nr:hypothetical protein [Burkholderia ambifaria]MBY4771149.1 hypothetical protein [Burkholderia ambifaria]